MKKNEVLEELFAEEDAALTAKRPAESELAACREQLRERQEQVKALGEELKGTLREAYQGLQRERDTAADLYLELEPAEQLATSGTTLQAEIDAAESLLEETERVLDALSNLRLLH